MRITGGSVRGKKISIKTDFKRKSYGIRPTSSKVREALFNIIGDNIINAVFVDLYAGTGIIGMEASSRGAKKVIMNELNKKYINCIKKSLEEMRLKNAVEIINLDARRFLMNSFKENKRYDIIFADPPYHSDELDKLICLISKIDILNDNGIFIIEHFKKKILPESTGVLEKVRQYRYGDTVLTLFRKIKNEKNSYLSGNI